MFDKDVKPGEIAESIEFYKELELIESNQWVWRPMVINIGSLLGEQMLNKHTDIDTNSMSIPYSIEDKIVEYMQKIVDFKSAETRDLFYALKVISKEDYNYSDPNSYNTVAHQLVKENGLIYVELLEKLVNLVQEVDDKVDYLVEKCIKNCTDNVFSDKDKFFLMKQIQKIKSRNSVSD